jgi:hypothetical protein
MVLIFGFIQASRGLLSMGCEHSRRMCGNASSEKGLDSEREKCTSAHSCDTNHSRWRSIGV